MQQLSWSVFLRLLVGLPSFVPLLEQFFASDLNNRESDLCFGFFFFFFPVEQRLLSFNHALKYNQLKENNNNNNKKMGGSISSAVIHME